MIWHTHTLWKVTESRELVNEYDPGFDAFERDMLHLLPHEAVIATNSYSAIELDQAWCKEYCQGCWGYCRISMSPTDNQVGFKFRFEDAEDARRFNLFF